MRLIEIKRCNLMNHVHHSIYLQEVLHTTIYTYYILSRIPNPNSKAHCKCLLSHALHLRLDLTSNHVATNVPVNGNPRARHPKKNPREKKHPRLFLSGVLFRDSLVVNENNPKGEFFPQNYGWNILSRLSGEGWTPPFRWVTWIHSPHHPNKGHKLTRSIARYNSFNSSWFTSLTQTSGHDPRSLLSEEFRYKFSVDRGSRIFKSRILWIQ